MKINKAQILMLMRTEDCEQKLLDIVTAVEN